MSSRNTLMLLVALVLGVIGTLAAQGRGAEPAQRPGEDLGESLRALALAQERTAAALERLEQHLGGQALPSEPSARTPVGEQAAPTSMPELIAALDALRRSMELESQRTRDVFRSAPALGGERLTDVRDERTEPDWAALGDLRTVWRRDQAEAKRSQYFQTARDLLREYGPPKAVYSKQNGMSLHYQRGEGEPSWFFILSDGLVVQFWMEDVEDE